MFRKIIKIAYIKFYCHLSELRVIKYKLKGYSQIVSFGDAEANLLKTKVLPIYNYLDSYNRINGFYTFIYSIILVAILVSLM